MSTTGIGGSAAATRLVRAGILAGIVGPIVAWSLTTVVIASWSGYDPVRQSVSILVDAPLGSLQTLAFALSGLLGAAWAFGLSAVLGTDARDRAIARGLLLVQALVVFGFALLPTDAIGLPTTTIGTLHLIDFYLYAVTMPLTCPSFALTST